MLKIYRAGEDSYFIRDHEGRLTTKQALALIETRFAVQLSLDEYECTIESFTAGREKHSNATLLRKKI